LLLFTSSCAFPGRVRPTVKIGLVAPFEGRYRYVGYDVIYAVRLALQQANQDGGISGYGVELVAYDDGAQPAMAVQQARKLDVDPAVVGALGHFRVATTAAARDVYTEAQIPLLVPTDLGSEVADGGTLYRLGPPADQLAIPLVDRATQRADDEAVVLLSDQGLLYEALRRAARQRDLALSSLSPDAEDWRSEVLSLDPAVVLCDLDPVSAGEVISTLRDHGWSGHVLGGPPLAVADFAAVAGSAADGSEFLTPWPFPTDVPGGDAFAAAYRQVSNGAAPGPLALPAYEGAWILVEALERAAADGAPTRARLSAVLPDVQRAGLLGRLAPAGSGASSDLPLFWYRIDAQGVPRLVESDVSSGTESISRRLQTSSSGL
jgi:ABC-type branched-subunit amino acid transport system substrate-binding protein